MGRMNADFFERFNLKTRYDIFFESGTLNGAAISDLLNECDIFDEYHSVEIDKNRFDNCVKKFKNHTNVTLYNGDSKQVLKKVLGTSYFQNKKVFFWLDAHWMGDVATKGNTHCPLLDELEAIKQLNIKPVIVIDDLFYMLNRNDSRYQNPEDGSLVNDASQWPVLDKIKSKIYEINEDYEITLSLIEGKEDYLIAK